MSRLINGTLTVAAFVATGNPGEYTFENALYTNLADVEGNGTYGLDVGFFIYTQAIDVNSFTGIPGVSHRYRITSITQVDFSTLSGTMIWDEDGPEIDSPANGVENIISQPAKDNTGYPASEQIYPNLGAGAALAAQNVDKSPSRARFGDFILDFLETDWVLDASGWKLRVNHNLNTQRLETVVLESGQGFQKTSVATDHQFLYSDLFIADTAKFNGTLILRKV